MAGYIYGTRVYQVTSPLVIARHVAGTDVYAYKNQLLPADIDSAQIESLLQEGHIRAIEEPTA